MKYIYSLLFCCIFFTASIQLHAQVVIGNETEVDLSPDEDAILDLRSGGNKGLLLPRLSLKNKYLPDPLSAHTAGMVVYNIGTNTILPEGYYFSDGHQWIQIVDTRVYSWYSKQTGRGAESNTDTIYQKGSVVVGSNELEPHVRFMIGSGDKGALLPRLTSAQIKNITESLSETEKKAIDGLMVYNLSNNCFSFFNGRTLEWRSLCAETPPAGMLVECFSDCKAYGNYKAQVNLTKDNFYRIRIRVNEPGAYDIRIATENGYNFAKSGTFNEVGVYVVDVPGQGVPHRGGTDRVKVYLNDVEVDDSSVIVDHIIVDNATASYAIVCEGATPGVVEGEYKATELLHGDTHFIKIKIEVKSGTGDEIIVETDEINGIKFQSDPIVLGDIGDIQEVKLIAYGTPELIGSYSYTPSYVSGYPCPFTVEVITTRGQFEDPAKSCLAIYKLGERTDGEYWVRTSSSSTAPVKTFCDMTNGGYTLIWSYSEYTAYSKTVTPYGSSSNTIVMDRSHQININIPRNVVNTEQGSIDYTDYRLSKATMQNIRTDGDYRVQIAYLPTDMNDEWAKIMHLYTTPPSGSDFINNSWGGGRDLGYFNVRGKIFGLELIGSNGRVTYNGRTAAGTRNWYNGDYYATHIDFGHDFYAGSSSDRRHTVTLPKHPSEGGTYSYTFSTRGFNNLFGWYGEDTGDHQFGKCRSDDYTNYRSSDSNGCSGSSKSVHSFNNGQGRYLQWWVK